MALSAAVMAMYARYWRPHSHPLTYAPRKLLAILESHDAWIDFRYALPNVQYLADEGCRWRMRLDPGVLQAHIDAFHLQPIAADPIEVQAMLRHYPTDWPDLATLSLNWYAFPYNQADQGYADWYVMAEDRKNGVLYFYYQHYNTVP